MSLTSSAPTLAYTLTPAPGAAPDAPLLVFVNGLGARPISWMQQVQQLGGRYPVLVYDHRGYGESQPGPKPGRMLDYAADLTRLLEEVVGHPSVAGRPVVGVGSSFGGRVLLQAALLKPERFAGLLVASSSLGGPAHAPGPDHVAVAMRRLDQLDAQGWMDVVIPAWFGRSWREAQGSRLWSLARWWERHPPPAAAVARQWEALDSCTLAVDVEAFLQDSAYRLPWPVTILHGTEDTLSPVANARALASALPGAKLVWLEGAGHTPATELPEAFAAAVEGVIGEIKRYLR